MVSSFEMRGEILLGEGALEQMQGLLDRLSIHRPLLVGEPSAALERVRNRLSGAVPFSSVDAFPTAQNALDGAESFVAGDCDGIVAAGALAVQEAAKAMRLKVTHPLHLEDYSELAPRPHAIAADLPPLIAIPLGIAAGAESSGRALLRTDALPGVIRLSSPHLRAAAVVSDPELSLGADSERLAVAALALLGAAYEGQFPPAADRFAASFSRAAVALTIDALPRVLALPKDLDALGALHQASILAGWNAAAPGWGLRLLAQTLAGVLPDPATAMAALLPSWLEAQRWPGPALDFAVPELRNFGVHASAAPRLAASAVDWGAALEHTQLAKVFASAAAAAQ